VVTSKNCLGQGDALVCVLFNIALQKIDASDLSAVVTSKNGLGQGDALVCVLFNIALQKIAKDADIQTNGRILCKSVQLFAYVDDRGIIARSQISLKEAFLTLEGAARRMGLEVGEENI
jgi:hypothetical protein